MEEIIRSRMCTYSKTRALESPSLLVGYHSTREEKIFNKGNIQLLPALTGTRWELELFSPHLLVRVRLAQLLHHRTAVSLLQDGINSLFWMVQHRLTLNGYVLEEIHLGLAIGQICPASLYRVFDRTLFSSGLGSEQALAPVPKWTPWQKGLGTN